MESDDQELKAISSLLKNAEFISAIRKHQIFSHRKKINGYVLVSIPFAVLKDTLETYPIYVFTKEKVLITVRSEHSSRSIQNTLDTFQDCLSEVCQYANASSFIVSRRLHKVSDGNLDVVMRLRAHSEEIEEKALAKPGDKKIGKRVFALKRQISARKNFAGHMKLIQEAKCQS